MDWKRDLERLNKNYPKYPANEQDFESVSRWCPFTGGMKAARFTERFHDLEAWKA